jgi:hypothetical protein
MPRDESNIIKANDVSVYVYVGNRRENNCQKILKPQYIFNGFGLGFSDSDSGFRTRTRVFGLETRVFGLETRIFELETRVFDRRLEHITFQRSTDSTEMHPNFIRIY